MVQYKKNTSSMQVTDFASLIWQANQAIMDNTIYNPAAVRGLVSYLERIMHPYYDSEYKKDIETINNMRTPAGKSQQARAASMATLQAEQNALLHCALMDLAYRKHFLPAGSNSSSAGSKNDFVIDG